MSSTPIPEFGSVPPSPEQLRRERRALPTNATYEARTPRAICYLDIWSPQFADENWTGQRTKEQQP